jgi:hypothetical protein
MAHRLSKALERPSAYAVKKTDFWDQLVDRIAGCILQSQLDDVEDWLQANQMRVPGSWDQSIQEMIEKQREQIASEDISAIIREKYDFT